MPNQDDVNDSEVGSFQTETPVIEPGVSGRLAQVSVKPSGMVEKPAGKKLSNPKSFIAGIIFFFLIVIVAGVVILSRTFSEKESLPPSEKKVVIGLSVGPIRTDRWEQDASLISDFAHKHNAVVNEEFANDDVSLQVTQAENLINQKVDALIIIPNDAEVTAQIVEKAHEAGIKVIAYDRMILSDKLDYYVSFDSTKVGELQAQGVLSVVNKGNFAYIGGSESDNNAFLLKEGSYKLLQPLIDKGDIQVVVDKFTPDWKPEEAYKSINDYLNSGGELDAVVAANDGTATGVVQALTEHGLVGKIPVSGQDAELTACQRLVAGTQVVTVYKPIRLLAEKAVEVALSAAENQKAHTNTQVSNGLIEVPSYLIDSVAVTIDNLEDTVIEDGFRTYEEVFGKSK